MMEKSADSCLQSCLVADESHHSDFALRTRFPSTSTSPPGANTVAQTQQRDKRRFYVKKAVIDIGRFKEWEEKLGDSWYRHHNKVNNIVYYHCKHEPCYASMKAKVMVEFVQLYVTEEGHTHPPFGNNTVITVNGDSANIIPPADFVMNAVSMQTNGVMARRFPIGQPAKRRRPSDEQVHAGWTSPLLYHQHLINELIRIQKDAKEPPRISNVQTEDGNSSAASISEAKPDAFLSASVIVTDASDGQKQGTSALQNSAGNDGENGIGEDYREAPQEPGTVNGAENAAASPGSSPEGLGTAPANAAFTAEPLTKQSGLNDSEDDDESSESDESNGVYSPVNIDATNKSGSPSSQSNQITTNDIFALLKAKVESHAPRRRLKVLRRVKRRLVYFVEMEELKCLAAKLPPEVKYEDVFQSNRP